MRKERKCLTADIPYTHTHNVHTHVPKVVEKIKTGIRKALSHSFSNMQIILKISKPE